VEMAAGTPETLRLTRSFNDLSDVFPDASRRGLGRCSFGIIKEGVGGGFGIDLAFLAVFGSLALIDLALHHRPNFEKVRRSRLLLIR